MFKIVQTPATVLVTPSEEVIDFDSSLKKLIQDMEETLDGQVDPEGVGLAAPQVGISKNIFIMKPGKHARIEVCINPYILEKGPEKKDANKSSRKKTPLEGCLSVPRIWSPVKRAVKVRLEYQDITGKKHVKWFTGFKAVIVQHEVDHLQGILFTQRALEQKVPLYEENKGKLEKLDY